jgi:hypothetical protein
MCTRYISSSKLLLTASKFMGFSLLFLLHPLHIKDSIVKRFMHCNLQHFCAHKYSQNSQHKNIGTLKSVAMYHMYNTNYSRLSTYCCDVHSFYDVFLSYNFARTRVQ